MGVSGIVCSAAACTLRALESASAGAIAAPDENSPRRVMASTVAFSMELPISTIEFFVSTTASAGIASTSVVASAMGEGKPAASRSRGAAPRRGIVQVIPSNCACNNA